MEDYLDKIFENIKLDENQKQAIIDDSESQMIIAGAGAGKTTTMAAKVKYLVDIKEVAPCDILLISFTNKAVNELKERIKNEFEIDAHIYTFHKLALLILKNAGIKKRIISDDKEIFIEFINIYISNNGIKNLKRYLSKYIDKTAFEDKEIIIDKYEKLRKIINEFNYFYNDQKIKLSKKEKMFFDLSLQYKQFYEKYLEENNLIDFNSMVKLANEYVLKSTLNYKYIIVDEYQDISLERYELLKKMTKKMKSKLIVVGDDWQSIFAFAGSRIDLFMNFKEEMKAKCTTIVNTYRNSQELIDIAGNFIMKDEKQIKKQLISNKNEKYPVRIVYYKEDKDKAEKLFNIIEELVKENRDYNILLLGRFQFDADFIYESSLYKKINDNEIIVKKLNKKVTFLTVHASKGLGFDQVIIINMMRGEFGFPSQKKDDIVLRKIKITDINEERRLFYVALTRTKNNVYLLTPKRRGSIFIKEIINMKGVKKIK